MALQIKVGNTTKTGGAAPVSQAVSWSTDAAWPVSAAPNACLMWTESGTPGGNTTYNAWNVGVGTNFGFSGAALDTFHAWSGSQDGGAFGGATAITIMDTRFIGQPAHSAFVGTSGMSAAALASYDSNGFTLTWDPDHADGKLLGYLAMSGLEQAKIISFTYASGDQEVTGVGFCPDLLIVLGFVEAGDPGTALTARMSLGFANHALQQQAVTWTTIDGGLLDAGHRHSNCGRNLIQNRFGGLLDEDDAATPLKFDVELTGMTTDGFTYTGTTHVALTVNKEFRVLCLKGIASQIGVTNKPTTAAPAAHAIALSGFTGVNAIMLASVQTVTNATPQTHDRLGFGAWDGVTQSAATHEAEDDHVNIGAGPFGFDLVGSCHNITRDDRLFIKCDNATPTTEAEAVGSALSTSGADLSWTLNDAVATELLYIVLGSGTSGVCEAVAAQGTWAYAWIR